MHEKRRILLYAGIPLFIVGMILLFALRDRANSSSIPPLSGFDAANGGKGSSHESVVSKNVTADPYIPPAEPVYPDPRSDPRNRPLNLTGWVPRITARAAEAAGLTDQERVIAQKTMDRTLQKVEARLTPLIQADGASSDPTKGVFAFRLNALPDRGRSLNGEFNQDLTAVLGSTKANILSGAMNDQQLFAGFGKYNTEFLFTPSAIPGNKPAVKVVCRNPETGAWVNEFSGDYESFQDKWGNTFTFDE